MNNLTQNYNLLSPTGFRLVVNRNTLGNLEYFATSVTLPSVSQGSVSTNMNQYKGYVHGDLEFEDLSMRIAIDEDMRVYRELCNWLIDQRSESSPIVYDATMIILTSHNNPNKSIKFKNIFPTSVGSLEFNTQSNDIEYLQADVSFRYDAFEFV